MKALAPQPADRYPNVDALRADLEQFLDGGGWFQTHLFSPGEAIVVEGEPADSAYIIVDGECEVYKTIGGTRTLLRRMGPGDVFGETAVLTRRSRSATVVASTTVNVKVVTRDSLERELERNPWMGAFLRALAERFLELDDMRRADAPASHQK
jgi:serine/threonine-protein kinase